MKFLESINTEKKQFFSKLKSYVYAYCEIDEDNKRIPIYIGKGKSDRCLEHLKNVNKKKDLKSQKIAELNNKNKLGIDILAYDLDDKTSFIIESACIDLMGIENLTNIVKGKGDNIKRVPIEELKNIILDKPVEILPEHRGVAILINRDFKPNFGDIEIFEVTRGVWNKTSVGVAKNSKYAYALYHGVVKEVYEIHSWVKAGTQEYFTREIDFKSQKNRFEFIGRKAPEELRKRYKGQLIQRKRSYGSPIFKL